MTSCTIPLSVLTAAPFSLTLGETIIAEIAAGNLYGTSAFSNSGGTAVI